MISTVVWRGFRAGLYSMSISVGSLKRFLFFISPGFCSLLIFLCWTDSWKRDFHVPVFYMADGIFILALIKILTHGAWYWSTNQLGAPEGFQMFDFPMSDNLHFAFLKLISLFTDSPGFIYNLYYCLTFFLVSISACWVFQKWHIHPALAWLGGVIYATTPFHWFRVGHLFLSGYYLIPPSCWLVIQFWNWCEAGRAKLSIKQIMGILLFLFLVSTAGVYYAFFSAYLFLIAGLAVTLNQRTMRPFLWSGLIAGVLGLGIVINISPSLIYHFNHGANAIVGNRLPIESEMYGLKLITLIMPVTSYGLPMLADTIRYYLNFNTADFNEKYYTYIGLIPLAGFGLLILRLFNLNMIRPGSTLLNKLSVLNVFILLFAVSGGGSTLFSFLISPEIRAYNRISIFIVFLALTAILVFLNRFLMQPHFARRWKIIGISLCFAVAFFDLFAMRIWTIANYEPLQLNQTRYRYAVARYNDDKHFVQHIEQLMPPNGMIMQLPVVAFPEGGMVNQMLDYDLFRGYLHSHTLRWSYGAIRGRQGLVWQQKITVYPVKDMILILQQRGFQGIYINRTAYVDNGKRLIAQISTALHQAPISDDLHQLVFFKL